MGLDGRVGKTIKAERQLRKKQHHVIYVNSERASRDAIPVIAHLTPAVLPPFDLLVKRLDLFMIIPHALANGIFTLGMSRGVARGIDCSAKRIRR